MVGCTIGIALCSKFIRSVGGGANFVGVNGSVLFCRLSNRSMLITSWLIILELRNLMFGLPDVSLVDRLGAMPVVTMLVFRASRCRYVSVVVSGGVLLITCGAALWVCVLARSGGAISGCVICGNAPGVLC